MSKSTNQKIYIKIKTLDRLITEIMMMMKELIEKLKNQIINQLCLEDLKPEDIDEKAPLFGEGLGLDSIDALELIVLLEREYGIKVDDPSEGKNIFSSIENMANYITANRVN
jgi:acyl carrier protein